MTTAKSTAKYSIFLKRFSAAFVVAVAIFSACSAPKVNLQSSRRSINPDDYTTVFHTWTRDISVVPFNGFDNVLTARATYLSHEFRQYFVERVATDLDSSPAEKAAHEAAEMAAMKEGHEFYVTLMSAVADCDDLSIDDEPWTIRLKNDKGAEAAPLVIEEVDEPMPRDIKYFFFDPKLRKAYRLKFPLTAGDGTPILSGTIKFFELSFATAYGRDTVRWEIHAN
jgi:hypothetical protein